jgi:cytochrome c oxidase assembly factor CtaG
MAQTRKRRRRKHRGTQGGRVDNRRRGRPRSRAEAQARARSRKRPARGESPPTWRGAVFRGGLMALAFVAVLLVFGRPLVAAILFGFAMVFIYIPMGFYFDRMMWRRRQRQKLRDAG